MRVHLSLLCNVCYELMLMFRSLCMFRDTGHLRYKRYDPLGRTLSLTWLVLSSCGPYSDIAGLTSLLMIIWMQRSSAI